MNLSHSAPVPQPLKGMASTARPTVSRNWRATQEVSKPAANLRNLSVIRCADIDLKPDACDAMPAARHPCTDKAHVMDALIKSRDRGHATAGLSNRKRSGNQSD